MSQQIERYDVIGCNISRLTMRGALDAVLAGVDEGAGGYVCFVNVHVCVTARQDEELRLVVNNASLALPDGRPVYLVGRCRGGCVEQIPGPDFMPMLLAVQWKRPLRHYFYGGRPEVLELLVQKIQGEYPAAQVVGYESPPFRPLSGDETRESLQRITEARPDIVWVGLGAPKQEKWMAQHWRALRPAILMGVGAAFDFHAGTVQRAPHWMSAFSLEWLYRLLQEPSRLSRRYLTTNSLFFYYLLTGK